MNQIGIFIADQAIREKGKRAFGEHNHGKPDELFRLLDYPFTAKLAISTRTKFNIPTEKKGAGN